VGDIAAFNHNNWSGGNNTSAIVSKLAGDQTLLKVYRSRIYSLFKFVEQYGHLTPIEWTIVICNSIVTIYLISSFILSRLRVQGRFMVLLYYCLFSVPSTRLCIRVLPTWNTGFVARAFGVLLQ
jgi:ABC-type maltose transport system permease subunit